ncbi:hypothetical protein BZL39_C03490 [Zygosaccharomyces parabailii]|nr:hypothetical protein BZL39_C03490 [Zygosaccharomyces parabailii]CDH09566.1 uncharacterized protein ZBAI_01350 [Zygosaccharomyces bailii ISA1307]
MVGEVHQDLEKNEQTSDEGKEFQLLEDKTAGKLVYFLSYWFWNFLWLIFVPYAGFQICFCLRASYLVAQVLWSYPEEAIDPPFPFTWLIVHCFLGIVYCIVSSYERVHMKTEALQNFLEGVASSDLAGDPIVWRRIAYKTNEHFRKMGYRYPLFYSGDQCLGFLIKDILKPVEVGSYDIRTYDNLKEYTDFCNDPSNKELVQRAVENYNKCIESYGDLSNFRNREERRSDQVDKIVAVILKPIYSWFLIQFAAIIVLWVWIILILVPSVIIRRCLLGS